MDDKYDPHLAEKPQIDEIIDTTCPWCGLPVKEYQECLLAWGTAFHDACYRDYRDWHAQT